MFRQRNTTQPVFANPLPIVQQIFGSTGYTKFPRLKLVRGLSECLSWQASSTSDFFSNKSDRATLVTHMCMQGVLDNFGMQLADHHTKGSYGRYYHKKDLKLEATSLISTNPSLNYAVALQTMSKTFVEEKVIRRELKSLLDQVKGKGKQLPLTGNGKVFLNYFIIQQKYFSKHCCNCQKKL